MMRFILAFLFLALAFVLQFWFASFGVYINFILATLIVCAFVFDIWDLVFFILAAIFIVNWQPAFSVEIVMIAVLPLAVFGFNRYSRPEAWTAAPASIVCGLIVFYLSIAPRFFFADWKIFLTDVAACLIFGGIVFAALTW